MRSFEANRACVSLCSRPGRARIHTPSRPLRHAPRSCCCQKEASRIVPPPLTCTFRILPLHVHEWLKVAEEGPQLASLSWTIQSSQCEGHATDGRRCERTPFPPKRARGEKYACPPTEVACGPNTVARGELRRVCSWRGRRVTRHCTSRLKQLCHDAHDPA